MTRGLEVVAAARAWLETPFVWGQSVKGVGCDCKGLVAGVARELDWPEAASVQALARDYRQVDPARLKAGLRALFDHVGTIEAGDVLLLTVAGKAQHLAIATGEETMIHCYARGPRRVVEAPLVQAMLIWPIDSIWRWRDGLTLPRPAGAPSLSCKEREA